LETESGRGDDFFLYLRRIELQAAILSDNPRFHDEIELGRTQSLFQETSTQLMVSITKFFNSALIYFSHGFFCKST
jgi:hypothetical protein